MIGERLKQIRMGKGLTQKAFAELLGTSSGYISEIEQGKKMPGSEFLISLKRELGVSLDWFLAGEGGTQALIVVGKRIESYRMGLRFKVGEFANLIGIPKEYLSDIEKQKVIPSTDDLKMIIRNTDINPQWLSTGEGPERKGDNRTGDGKLFYAFGEEEIDDKLKWKILQTIHSAMLYSGLDPEDLPDDKRIIIKDLLYDDAIRKERQPDEKYANRLCQLTSCEICESKKRKERWQHKWHIEVPPGLDLEQVPILVKAASGLKCPMEGIPKHSITDSAPVMVHCTAYYRKQLDDGSLVVVKGKREERPIKEERPSSQTGGQITQTVSGTGHKVAGRDIVGDRDRGKK